tara:strand:+ start:1955 stop:3229 length:1275 start_codon:yes stop_codon:yes gene_type:complete
MSKSSREGLFGITLTELVIILFFIMLLLAIFRIEKVEDERDTVEEELIRTQNENGIATSTLINWIDPNGYMIGDFISITIIEEKIKELVEQQGVLSAREEELVALAGQAAEADRLKAEKQKLEEEMQELEEEMQELQEALNAENESLGKGDCGEGFWVTPKCADNCWAINNPDGSRQYDYLIDIGVCESYVVVQESQWIEKTDYDFSQVKGADAIVNKRQMSRKELYDMLDVIKEPGYQLEPKQCFHAVRLIDLGTKSIDVWERTAKQVNGRVMPLVLTKSNGSTFRSVRQRFNDDVCDDELFKSQFKESAVKDLDKNTKSLPVITRAKMYPNFSYNFTNNKDCKDIRSSTVIFEFEITVNESGEASRVKYSDNIDNLSKSQRKLLDIAKEALYQTKYTPALSDGRAIESVLRQPIKLPRGVCQ